MPDAVLLDMPTDLRSTNARVSPFELQENKSNHRGITALTIDIADTRKTRQNDTPRPPPLWRTPEFFFYYLIAAVVIPFMVWVPINLSSLTHANYPIFQYKLSPGWLFGRRIDNSDAQYRSFRNNVPALAFLVLVYIALKSMYIRVATRSMSGIPTDNTFLVPFTNLFAILYLIGLHGTSTLKIFIILTANYHIGKYFAGSRACLIITWIFNFLILFANEWNEGYLFSSLHPDLAPLDAFRGIFPRWQISFNITTLRLVSFNMDYYWACTLPYPPVPETILTEKQRCTLPHPLEYYTYANYLAYVLFPPLYIAGPILTFNNFMWQLRRPVDIRPRTFLSYLMRFLITLLTMEFILHYMYLVAIKDTKAWQGDTPLELSMIGLWNLIIVWLKLLLPWRFFRLWSLASGIDPPENMVRCMINNYSTLGFWRSWHRSYNLWIVRYIYIPLGGTKNMAMTTALIFTFVALWHDLSFHLLAWGWLVSAFILPEVLAAKLLPQSRYGRYAWYRHVCACGGVINALTMITANLVGFVIGTDGILYMVNQIVGSLQGLQFLIGACGCIFVGVQLMFEYREEEMRRGIFRRC
ncbi:MBOAT, membrane-bound O-acyltransferase family-domain-containing protein [Boletus edulis BED1]|uniref:MBOAT, membrane-bound O-acyltransferase family-domain-containing protein n=1 Tax=Boletus edulis BED1 TaxID=1328754 RepID=A0AAD4GG91_BOLED|nr:MBOAT, membrane-bound O-acyltransferase family-domain-containing protein [Boletus edulis BED1]